MVRQHAARAPRSARRRARAHRRGRDPSVRTSAGDRRRGHRARESCSRMPASSTSSSRRSVAAGLFGYVHRGRAAARDRRRIRSTTTRRSPTVCARVPHRSPTRSSTATASSASRSTRTAIVAAVAAVHELAHETIEPSAAVAFAAARAARPRRLAASASSARAATARLTPLEFGVALLGERGHALLQVVARERARASSAAISARAGVDKPLRLGDEVERPLVTLHGERRRRRDLAGERERGARARRARRTARARAAAPRRRRRAAREQEVARRALTDELREPPDVARR